MAKCLIGANGSGKVTVEGLSAGKVLAGTIVKVLQGEKEIANVSGKLDILVFGYINYDGGHLYYWNGSGYSKLSAARNNPSATVRGKFVKAIAAASNGGSDYNFSVGGNTYTANLGVKEYTSFSNSVISFSGWGLWDRILVVIGEKT